MSKITLLPPNEHNFLFIGEMSVLSVSAPKNDAFEAIRRMCLIKNQLLVSHGNLCRIPHCPGSFGVVTDFNIFEDGCSDRTKLDKAMQAMSLEDRDVFINSLHESIYVLQYLVDITSLLGLRQEEQEWTGPDREKGQYLVFEQKTSDITGVSWKFVGNPCSAETLNKYYLNSKTPLDKSEYVIAQTAVINLPASVSSSYLSGLFTGGDKSSLQALISMLISIMETSFYR